MRFSFLIVASLLTLSGLSQIENQEVIDTFEFVSFETLLEKSEIINDETFDFMFLVRALPDNAWFLKLKKDSTYEYIHWSGFGENEGTILESGKYSISKNVIDLEPNSEKSQLENKSFSLITSLSNEIDNNFNIDCVSKDSKFYCLCQK